MLTGWELHQCPRFFLSCTHAHTTQGQHISQSRADRIEMVVVHADHARGKLGGVSMPLSHIGICLTTDRGSYSGQPASISAASGPPQLRGRRPGQRRLARVHGNVVIPQRLARVGRTPIRRDDHIRQGRALTRQHGQISGHIGPWGEGACSFISQLPQRLIQVSAAAIAELTFRFGVVGCLYRGDGSDA